MSLGHTNIFWASYPKINVIPPKGNTISGSVSAASESVYFRINQTSYELVTTIQDFTFQVPEGVVITDLSSFLSGTPISIDLTDLDTSHATTMNNMFGAATTLRSIDITGMDTGNVTDMSYMFSMSPATTLTGITNLNTGSVTDMSYMFYYYNGMLSTLDLSGWDTSNVTDMSHMFAQMWNSRNLVLHLESWDTSSVVNYQNMFTQWNGWTIYYDSTKFSSAIVQQFQQGITWIDVAD